MQTVEVPVDGLSLSEDVPQFKLGANNEGVVDSLGGMTVQVLVPL